MDNKRENTSDELFKLIKSIKKPISCEMSAAILLPSVKQRLHISCADDSHEISKLFSFFLS